MATDASFAAYVVDQARGAGRVTVRKMFGEYAVYCDDTVVALACDNQLFVKPTDGGRRHAGDVELAPPYPGGKPWLSVTDRIDDGDWLVELLRITAREAPPPRRKKAPKAKGAGEKVTPRRPGPSARGGSR